MTRRKALGTYRAKISRRPAAGVAARSSELALRNLSIYSRPEISRLPARAGTRPRYRTAFEQRSPEPGTALVAYRAAEPARRV